MKLDDARVQFRYMSKMTVRAKESRSSEFRNNIDCRHCNTREEESKDQRHNGDEKTSNMTKRHNNTRKRTGKRRRNRILKDKAAAETDCKYREPQNTNKQ